MKDYISKETLAIIPYGTKKTKVIYNGLSDYIIKGISKNKFEEKKGLLEKISD